MASRAPRRLRARPRVILSSAARLSSYIAHHSRRSRIVAVSRPWEPVRVVPSRNDPAPDC